MSQNTYRSSDALTRRSCPNCITPCLVFFFFYLVFILLRRLFVSSSSRFICLFYLYPTGLGPNCKINTINYQKYNAPLKLKGWKKIWIRHKCGVTGHYDKLLAVYRGTLKRTTRRREKEGRALKSMLDGSIFESIELLKTFLKIEKKFARRLPLDFLDVLTHEIVLYLNVFIRII